jgi:hypothetical protein
LKSGIRSLRALGCSGAGGCAGNNSGAYAGGPDSLPYDDGDDGVQLDGFDAGPHSFGVYVPFLPFSFCWD